MKLLHLLVGFLQHVINISQALLVRGNLRGADTRTQKNIPDVTQGNDKLLMSLQAMPHTIFSYFN